MSDPHAQRDAINDLVTAARKVAVTAGAFRKLSFRITQTSDHVGIVFPDHSMLALSEDKKPRWRRQDFAFTVDAAGLIHAHAFTAAISLTLSKTPIDEERELLILSAGAARDFLPDKTPEIMARALVLGAGGKSCAIKRAKHQLLENPWPPAQAERAIGSLAFQLLKFG